MTTDRRTLLAAFSALLAPKALTGVALVDGITYTGLPVTPNGGHITLVWPNREGILKLA